MLEDFGWDADGPCPPPAGTASRPGWCGPTAAGVLLATGAGEVRATGPALVTGDWTQYLPAADPADTGTAVRLPRRTELVRGAGGRAAARQALAANVDLVYILVSLAAPPNAGRLARLLAVAWDSGARPVVVLTKADLAEGTAAAERDEVAETALGAPVLLTSTVDGRGLAELRAMLRPGRTAALLGVSGAGKSSLRNALAGQPGAEVGAVGRTGKGRHTTTARELTLLPGGGLLLDTPGLRGVQLWAADGGLDQAFADIVERAGRCRYRDCRHDGEPDCAVASAVADGTLSARRVAAHAALRAEVGWLRERYDARDRAEQRREWRRRSKAVRAGRRQSPRTGGSPKTPQR